TSNPRSRAAIVLAAILCLGLAPGLRAGTLAVATNSCWITRFDTETGEAVGTDFNIRTVETNASIYCLQYDTANGDLWVGLQGGATTVTNFVLVLRDSGGALAPVHAFRPPARSGSAPNVYDIEVISGLGNPVTEVWVSHNWRYAYNVSLTRYDGTTFTTIYTSAVSGSGSEGLTSGTGYNLWWMAGAAHRQNYNRLYDRSTFPDTSLTTYDSNKSDAQRGAIFYPGTVKTNGVEAATGVVLVGAAEQNHGWVWVYAEDGSYLGALMDYGQMGINARGVRDLDLDESGALYLLSVRDSGTSQFVPQIVKYVYATNTASTFKSIGNGYVLNAVSYLAPIPASGATVLLIK
ncbi:MAG: hypothetical protein JW741_12330, partial [Sedimentisphaerales bacterium]|nr:hypothetical protein [Sedimentisphaerales bacterium]